VRSSGSVIASSNGRDHPVSVVNSASHFCPPRFPSSFAFLQGQRESNLQSAKGGSKLDVGRRMSGAGLSR
jgi:hypothetical protein